MEGFTSTVKDAWLNLPKGEFDYICAIKVSQLLTFIKSAMLSSTG